jgi:hypothetical protein
MGPQCSGLEIRCYIEGFMILKGNEERSRFL